MITLEQRIKLEQCLIKLSLQSGFDSFNSFRINQEYILKINIQKNKLVERLTKLALSLGFNSFIEFKKYIPKLCKSYMRLKY